IGKSYEGRDIWLVTVTNTETGSHTDKPGLLIEANIHSMEWTGCAAALHLIHKLLNDHGNDELVTRALDTRTFYVIPRLNPDGAERGLKERRFIRSSVRPYPRDEPDDGLQIEDVDGDGRVLDMRIEDPNGAWGRHPDEPGRRSTSSVGRGRTRPRSRRYARWCRRSPTGQTLRDTSLTTRSAACTCARMRAGRTTTFRRTTSARTRSSAREGPRSPA